MRGLHGLSILAGAWALLGRALALSKGQTGPCHEVTQSVEKLKQRWRRSAVSTPHLAAKPPGVVSCSKATECCGGRGRSGRGGVSGAHGRI